jgi:hypothetical protein
MVVVGMVELVSLIEIRRISTQEKADPQDSPRAYGERASSPTVGNTGSSTHGQKPHDSRHHCREGFRRPRLELIIDPDVDHGGLWAWKSSLS